VDGGVELFGGQGAGAKGLGHLGFYISARYAVTRWDLSRSLPPILRLLCTDGCAEPGKGTPVPNQCKVFKKQKLSLDYRGASEPNFYIEGA
jgi:hypothetical protein